MSGVLLLLMLLLLLLVVAVLGVDIGRSVLLQQQQRRQVDERRRIGTGDDDNEAAPPAVMAEAFVGTIDGTLHAIDAQNGETLWSFSSGDALFSSTVALGDSSATSATRPIFIPGVDGAIFAHTADKKLRRLPITVKDIVARSPFQTADGTVLAGRKSTRIFVLDRASGVLLRQFSSDAATPTTLDAARDIGEPLTGDAIVFGRSDYYISALDAATGAVAWNMSRLSISRTRLSFLLTSAHRAAASTRSRSSTMARNKRYRRRTSTTSTSARPPIGL